MRWVKRDSAGPAIVGCCLLITCLGCRCPRPRHGLILRGDWSLELNRLPWLNSRAKTWQDCSNGETECDGSCGLGAGLPTRGLAGANRTGHSPCRSSTCEISPSSGAETVPGSSAESVGYHNHPRFHPVPTQPVFQPRPDRFFLADVGPPPEVHRTPVPTAAERPPISPAPQDPEPEVIPAPPAGSPQGWKPRGPEHQEASGDGPNWIFRPAVDHRRDPMTPAQRHVETGSGPIITR